MVDSDVRLRFGTLPITVEAVLDKIELPVREVLALVPGSVLMTKRNETDGLLIYAGEVAIAYGQPSGPEAKRSVSVTELFTEE